MQEMIKVTEKELRLCSNLDESGFGKTNFYTFLKEDAYFFDGSNFSLWNFSEIKTLEDEKGEETKVWYCGKNPLSKSAKTLLEFFDEKDDKKARAVKAVVNAMTQAAKYEKKLPIIGAGGILVDLGKTCDKVLFFPEELYKSSINGLSKEDYFNVQGAWENNTLTGLPALVFERGVIAYKFLTDNFPFNSTDLTERNADILDQKFLPLELCLDKVDPVFAKEVNRALKLTSSYVNVPGKKQKGKNSEDLTPNPEFPIELLDSEAEKAKSQKKTEDNQSFSEKAQAYMKLKESKINAKRKLRRNSAKIGISLILALFIFAVVLNTIQTKSQQYTSTGLTSTQTIQAFFMGYNARETNLLGNLVRGKSAKAFNTVIDQVYIISKERQVYEQTEGFTSPSYWLLACSSEKNYDASSVFGVSQLKIDGKNAELDIPIYKKNENAEIIKEEGGVKLKNNDKSIHKVEYYLLHSDDEDNHLKVDKVSGTFTLTYVKDRWVISDIVTENEELSLDGEKFKKDYLEQVTNNGSDAIGACSELRSEYPWLPSNNAIQKEIERLQYNNLNPTKQKTFAF